MEGFAANSMGMLMLVITAAGAWAVIALWRALQDRQHLIGELNAAQNMAHSLEVQHEQVSNRLAALEEEIDAAREAKTEALKAQVTAETRMEELEKQLVKAFEERTQAISRAEMAFTQKQAADQRVALVQQDIKAMEERMRDWETLKEQSLHAAKASVLEAGHQLSSKLLEDHKREAEEARKQQEESTQKTTQGLTKEFQTVLQHVATLREQVGEQRGTVERVWKALTVPGEVGRFSEIGLENTLKAFGLQPGRDYRMQYSVEGEAANKLRPDAIIFLPHETVMVIDSKASQFLLQFGAAEGEVAKLEAAKNLKGSMQRHLKGLAAKDYEQAVRAAHKQANGKQGIRRVLNVMYLPSEAALDHIQQADPEFTQSCMNSNIILAGPTGLAGLMALCRMEIQLAQQAENQELIMQTVSELLDRTGVALGKAGAIGKNLKQAAEQYSEFSASVNGRLLATARKLGKLGIRPAKNKDLPKQLPSFSVLEETHMIELEAEEAVEEAAQPMQYLTNGDDKAEAA
ncbi:DNA recombination protein RmuC [bacterium]|nr:DNA recombination protein RmuC [bacterium]